MNKPVLLMVFNRPRETALVFASIKAARPARLFIAADGPRTGNEGDIVGCEAVRGVVSDINWDCQVERLYQKQNLGCSMGPRTAINWFFNHVECGIILEDDCLASPDFYSFCSAMLDHYRDDPKVLNICGSNMGDNKRESDGYFFSRFMNMSGWATWRRSAEAIDYELLEWKRSSRTVYDVYRLLRQSIADTDIHWYRYWKDKFDRTVSGESVSWWDWQWIFFQLSNKKLSVIPNRNLVTNIGFNAEATHTKDANNPLSNIPVAPMNFPLVHPINKNWDKGYEEHFVKWVWCYHKRLPASFYLKRFFKQAFHLEKK